MQAMIFKNFILIGKEIIPCHSCLENFMLNLVELSHHAVSLLWILPPTNFNQIGSPVMSWVQQMTDILPIAPDTINNFLLYIIRQKLSLIMKCLFGAMPALHPETQYNDIRVEVND